MPHQPEKSLEQIVQEVGCYAMDAYVFVQECIGLASETVHGPLKPEAMTVAQWMSRHEIGPEELRRRLDEGQLPPEIAAAVELAGGPESLNRHVTGQQLCWAIRDAALKRWGLMARGVLGRWGVTRTEDIGAIIFALVNNGWLQKQPTDSIEDFNNVFSFREAFDAAYRIGDN
ncbi:MAG: hypothetical protein AMXMBFR13_21200 [Phycisphaerae bacterium]